MASNKKKLKQASGGARLVASGKRPVTLGLRAVDYDLLKLAAEKENRHLTQFLIYHGLKAAKKLSDSS